MRTRIISDRIGDLLYRSKSLEQRRRPHILEEIFLNLLRSFAACLRKVVNKIPYPTRLRRSGQDRINEHFSPFCTLNHTSEDAIYEGQ